MREKTRLVLVDGDAYMHHPWMQKHIYGDGEQGLNREISWLYPPKLDAGRCFDERFGQLINRKAMVDLYVEYFREATNQRIVIPNQGEEAKICVALTKAFDQELRGERGEIDCSDLSSSLEDAMLAFLPDFQKYVRLNIQNLIQLKSHGSASLSLLISNCDERIFSLDDMHLQREIREKLSDPNLGEDEAADLRQTLERHGIEPLRDVPLTSEKRDRWGVWEFSRTKMVIAVKDAGGKDCLGTLKSPGALETDADQYLYLEADPEALLKANTLFLHSLDEPAPRGVNFETQAQPNAPQPLDPDVEVLFAPVLEFTKKEINEEDEGALTPALRERLKQADAHESYDLSIQRTLLKLISKCIDGELGRGDTIVLPLGLVHRNTQENASLPLIMDPDLAGLIHVLTSRFLINVVTLGGNGNMEVRPECNARTSGDTATFPIPASQPGIEEFVIGVISNPAGEAGHLKGKFIGIPEHQIAFRDLLNPEMNFADRPIYIKETEDGQPSTLSARQTLSTHFRPYERARLPHASGTILVAASSFEGEPYESSNFGFTMDAHVWCGVNDQSVCGYRTPFYLDGTAFSSQRIMGTVGERDFQRLLTLADGVDLADLPARPGVKKWPGRSDIRSLLNNWRPEAFSGTSASCVVAARFVANIQAKRHRLNLLALKPFALRSHLRSTGYWWPNAGPHDLIGAALPTESDFLSTINALRSSMFELTKESQWYARDTDKQLSNFGHILDYRLYHLCQEFDVGSKKRPKFIDDSITGEDRELARVPTKGRNRFLQRAQADASIGAGNQQEDKHAQKEEKPSAGGAGAKGDQPEEGDDEDGFVMDDLSVSVSVSVDQDGKS